MSANNAPLRDKIRLSKLMADKGLCSRREADVFIEKGWVQVNGATISILGTKVEPQAKIELDPRAQKAQQRAVTILLNKPVGIVSSQPEKGYKAAVSLIKPNNRDKRDPQGRFHTDQFKGLAVAGRLDIDSTGLLVLTQNGNIARQLIGPDSDVEKEYLVRVQGQINDDSLKQLRHGLALDGQLLKPAIVSQLNPDQLQFILKEGKKRQIRRMCQMVGLSVTGLKRVRIGRIRLGSLAEGKWRYLGPKEHF